MDEATIEKETRRPVLLGFARQLGVEVNPSDNIAVIKENIMAAVKVAPKAPAKPVPAKPAPAKPVAAAPAKPAPAKPAPAKPVPAKPAPAKPAAPAPHANGVAKPGAMAAPKPAAAPAKPAPAKPAALAPAAAKPAAAAPAAAGTPKAEFDAFVGEVTKAFESITARLDKMELVMVGLDPNFVSIGEDGMMVFDLDNAPAETIREWAWVLNVCDHNADPEEIRAFMKSEREKKGFKGWEVTNGLPLPGETATEVAAEAAAEETPAEEPIEINAEWIAKANWTDLTALADQIGLDYSDLKPQQPKILRTRLTEYLAAAQAAEGGEEAAAAEAEGEGIVEGTAVSFEFEGSQYTGVFNGFDADGDFVITLEDGQQVAVAKTTELTAAA